jgi:vancomycin resistance protein YoaR
MTSTSTPAPAPVPESHRGRSLGLRFAIAFLLGLLLVAVLGVGALYAYGQHYSGRILPGVHIGAVDLSGMDAPAARRALADAYGSLDAGRVVISGPEGQVTVSYQQLARGPDLDAMVAEALAAGRQGQPVADLIGAPQAALRGVTLAPRITYDASRLAAAAAVAGKSVDRAPVNATLTTTPDGEFEVTDSVDGRTVDQAALVASIEDRIGSFDAPSEVTVDMPVTSQPPAIDTASALETQATAERMTSDLVLTLDNKHWKISGDHLRKLVSFSVADDGSITPVIDEAGIDPLLKPVAKAIKQNAVNAGFKYSGGRIVVGSKSREGRELDTAATHALVYDALMAREVGAPDQPVEPVVATTDPLVTTAMARQYAPRMRSISSWTTWFPIDAPHGFGKNIWIPATLINGTVVGPGEEFDFWKTVGPVTTARGFVRGGAIINGKTELQGALAGGICSCSTTLFNAALRAGMQMEARRNHYYYISRYPLGLDATVFKSDGGSTQTMSFINDTQYPILIRGINTRKGSTGYVTFKIYSVPNHRTVSISKATVKNFRRATDAVVRTSSLPVGVSKRVEYPVDGMDVWRTVTVKEKGKVIRTTTYYSHYSTITGVVQVGTGGSTGTTATSKP